MTDVVDNITEIQRAVLHARLFEYRRNIRPLHEAEMRCPAPIIRLNFPDNEALRIVDPWHRFANRVQHKQMFLQGPIMFYMPDHDRWDNVRSPGEKNAGAGNARNILRFERTHELLDRDLLLSEALCYRRQTLGAR